MCDDLCPQVSSPVKEHLLDTVEISSEDKIEALSGIAYLMRHICAVLLMCDVKDLGVALEDNITKSQINRQFVKNLSTKSREWEWKERENLRHFEPNIYIYDSYPNGIGFSEVLFERAGEIFEKILDAIKQCNCERGCPSCVGPPIRSNDNHKDAARFIISLILDRVYH